MSIDVKGGQDYALIKRHYDNYDYAQLTLVAATQQSYVIGTSAYLADTTLATTKEGWTVYTPTAPLPIIYQLLGLTYGPAFEGKDILLYASADTTVSFDAPTRVQALIPANTFMRFHTRSFVIYATCAAGGTLDIWCEG